MILLLMSAACWKVDQQTGAPAEGGGVAGATVAFSCEPECGYFIVLADGPTAALAGEAVHRAAH